MYKQFVSSQSIRALLVLGFAPVLSAQLNSSTQAINITAHTAESISVSLTAGSTVTFTLPATLGNVILGSATPAWTTSWVLQSSRTAVKTYVYFVTPTALIGLNAANVIPGTGFLGTANGGSQTAFTAAAVSAFGMGGAGMLVSTTTINSANLTGSKNDSLVLGLQAIGSLYTPDTYTGSLFIQAQATP
jgi:hypothetical protein